MANQEQNLPQQEPPFTDHMLSICSAAKLVVFKAPKPSLNAERVRQGTKSGAQPGHKKHSTSSKQPSVSSREATKGGSSKAPTSSKTGHLKRKKESSSAMDSNPSQTSASTPVVAEMHKEDQQATGGPTSLRVTSKERADPQLSSGMSAFNFKNEPIFSSSFIIHLESSSRNDASAVSIAEADPRKSAPRKGASFIARQVEEDEASRTIKLEDLAKLVSSVQPRFKDLDSPKDDPIIVVDDSDEDEEANKVHATINTKTEDASHKLELEMNKAEAEAALLRAQPSFPNIRQLNELLEFSKILSAHDFSRSLPTELKELPSKFNELTKEVKSLKKQVHNLEIELPGELKEIPTKLEDLPRLSQVLRLSLLHKVTNALNQFAQAIASKKTEDDSVSSAGQAGTQPAEGKKNTNQATISQKDKDKKALSSKEAEKEGTNSDSDDDETHVTGSMVESSRIKKVTKIDFVTEDGKHIHLTEEQINQQKKIEEDAKSEAAKRESEVRKEELVDLLGLEVVNKYYNDKLQYDRYCDKMLNRRAESRITNCDVLTRKGSITLKVYRETGKGWTTIYDHIRTRMDYIHTTEVELDINLDIPQSEQNPLDKLYDLANKKRKHVDDIHHYFKANKRLKSSVQYEDYLAGTMLNEHVLGMIMFNSYHRQEFVIIEDLKDFSNIMLYTVHEIFFRRHQGPGLDDYARTFSSLLLAEVDKKNLNPLKQIRVIEQLGQ
ncbi:hypothetical protein Tco_0757033 [Tanacetum coccineum]